MQRAPRLATAPTSRLLAALLALVLALGALLASPAAPDAGAATAKRTSTAKKAAAKRTKATKRTCRVTRAAKRRTKTTASAARKQATRTTKSKKKKATTACRKVTTKKKTATARKPTSAAAPSSPATTTTPATSTISTANTAPLRFGIYPGGGAGAVGPSGIPKPEDPVKRLAALKALRAGGKPFVLHLYEDYRTPADAAQIPSWLKDQVDEATANGFEVEMVLRYRPSATDGDVAGYETFVRNRVRQYGANPGVTALQITNEANITVAPDAADGWYPKVREALVRGVIAADAEARAAGHTHLRFGFNWAYETSSRENDFYADLARIGGGAFAAAVDWVGIDAYPGTWGPQLASGDLASAVHAATIGAMRTLRTELMPLAGLGAATAIRFAESGYPTDDAARSETNQLTVMQAAIATISEQRATYGVTDYRWFDLRDADSDFDSFESHYGITRDDYSPKPGFDRFRALVAQLG